ncbi:MAG: PE-PPE domain-containing protein [Pseudonocardia sediminis]
MRGRTRGPARLLLVTALLLGTALGAAATAGATPARAADCADTTVFEADGYRGGQTLPNWNASAFNASPPAGWKIVPVPYDAYIFPGVDPQTLDASVAQGVGLMRAAVLDEHRACPGTRLVLAGFSEGAIVAGNALETFAGSTEIPHEQLNGVLYGNPRRPFGEGGTGGRAGGIETNLPTILPGVTMQGGHDYGDLAVRNVCNENDGICNSANLITNLPAFANGLAGYRGGDHDYTLDPAADLGSGLLFHRQPPRLPYGPPVSADVGTPWEIQQRFGGSGAEQRVAAARPGLTALLGPGPTDQPWYRLVTAARP